MRRLPWILCALSVLLAPAWPAADESDGWQLLKSLAGDWRAGTSEGKTVDIAYQVISKGSAVMETMKAEDGSPLMITVYHRDGDALMLTHYCAAGNQPRMRSALKPSEGKRLAFRFLDVTNLSSPDAQHIHDLTITFTDPDHIVQEWTHRGQGKEGATIFRLTRRPR